MSEENQNVAPIRRMGGKLQAAGVVILASGVIMALVGGWWGPALLFPGAVIFALGKFME